VLGDVSLTISQSRAIAAAGAGSRACLIARFRSYKVKFVECGIDINVIIDIAFQATRSVHPVVRSWFAFWKGVAMPGCLPASLPAAMFLKARM
jgi:hypothetical protein